MAITYGFFVSIGLLFIVVIVLLAFFYSRHRRAGAVGTTNSSPGAKNVAIGEYIDEPIFPLTELCVSALRLQRTS